MQTSGLNRIDRSLRPPITTGHENLSELEDECDKVKVVEEPLLTIQHVSDADSCTFMTLLHNQLKSEGQRSNSTQLPPRSLC